jgi:hypothetical protein
MIAWFDDLDLGTRSQGAEVKVTPDDIKRFAVEFDPVTFSGSRGEVVELTPSRTKPRVDPDN